MEAELIKFLTKKRHKSGFFEWTLKGLAGGASWGVPVFFDVWAELAAAGSSAVATNAGIAYGAGKNINPRPAFSGVLV